MTQIFQGRTDIPMRTVRDIEDAAQWLNEVAEIRADVDQVVSAAKNLMES